MRTRFTLRRIGCLIGFFVLTCWIFCIGLSVIARVCAGIAHPALAMRIVNTNALNFIIHTPYAAQASDLSAKCQMGLSLGLVLVVAHHLLDGAVIFHVHGEALYTLWLTSDCLEVESGVPALALCACFKELYKGVSIVNIESATQRLIVARYDDPWLNFVCD